MKLFTKDIDKKLFAQYPKGNNLEQQMAVAKIFNPYGNGRWFLLNSDPQDPDYLWAIVQMGQNVEIGSVSRKELENLRISAFRFPLERDLGFTPVNAYELFKGLREGKFYKAGGFTEQSENKEMLLNQAEEIEHHVEEFKEAAKKSDHVPAWVVAKAERASTDLSDASHYLEAENEQKKEEVEGEEEYANGGEVKWQEAEYGDSALVVSENKMGIIMKPYGRKFHLKFVDGTEKTYDANDLKFFKDIDDFDRGGEMADGGGTSSPNSEFMKWFDNWSNSVNKYVHVSISIPNEFSSPIKDGKGKIVMLDLIEKKGDTDAKKYMNEILKKADEFGVSIYLQPIPRTHNLKSQEHKDKITKDYLVKYYQKFGFENTDGGFMVRAPKMAEGGMTDPMATVNEISRLSGLRPIAVAEWGDKNNINLSILLKDLKSKKIKGMDLMTAIVGNPNNKYQKELLAKYSRTKMAEGGIVYDIEWVDKEGDILEASFQSLEEAKEELKKIREEGGRVKQTWKYRDGEYVGTFAEGGNVKFKDKVASIKASLLKRKKVPKVVQKDYGKTFTPAEAEDSAKRIVGAQTAKERLMMRIKSKKKK